MRVIAPVRIGITMFFMLLTTALSAQTRNGQLPRSIRVVAEATASVQPDQAEIDIGVTTQAQTSSDAATRNAQHFNTVLQALATTLGPSADAKTISYTLRPDYQYPKDGEKPRITSYSATNTVRVTLRNLDRVTDAMDAAAKAGANQIGRVHFTLKDRQTVESQVLREAATKARSQADALASALGLKVARVLSVIENEPVMRPYPEVMALRADRSAATHPE